MTDDSPAQASLTNGSPKDRSSAPSAPNEPIFANESPNQTPPGPARIRKKRSNANVQSAYHAKDSTSGSPAAGSSVPTLSQSSTPVKAARKGSIRNVVRRLFGRKAKAEQKETPKASNDTHPPPSRHGHSTSDPGNLRTIQEQPQDVISAGESLPQRTLSAPQKRLDPPGLRRGRSAYAVEFPQSSRLKPLDLGNPFHKDSREPRRRATLPSIIVDEREALALARAINVRSEDPTSDRGIESAADHNDEIGLAVTTPTRKQNRRSRSVDDLRRMVQSAQPVRDRDSEVEFWRQSAIGSMFRQPVQNDEDTEPAPEDDSPASPAVSPIRRSEEDPFVVHAAGHAADDRQVSPLHDEQNEKVSPMRDSPLMSRPATAEEKSNDLELRVLQLENNLASFQIAIDRLTARTNRRTVIIDSAASRRTSRQNTPSVLINSLLDADYRYSNTYGNGEENYSLRAGAQEEPQRPRQSMTQPSPARTYAALYSIINQERSARRALEEQVRSLQDNLSEMQYQLSQPIIGRHSSAYQPQPQLHPSYPRMPHFSNVPNTIDPEPSAQRLTSRFSLSESLTDSEAARLREARDLDTDDDRTKSFDLYETPASEQRQSTRHVVVEGGMF
ncbi:hypothetical protein K461DRAFT_312030 [Myriangium duriaei CBS 260.36]|uniref:Uncharacterized protein n=1 Tax=Myriangium duriaei CBS 260.36 TaxID=1168546 RepID=A0A9P4MLC0_9PEZI|nr:hypothetical protein K461DRAFT_312030 [Myriangium duriaei CBS 260.36]